MYLRVSISLVCMIWVSTNNAKWTNEGRYRWIRRSCRILSIRFLSYQWTDPLVLNTIRAIRGDIWFIECLLLSYCTILSCWRFFRAETSRMCVEDIPSPVDWIKILLSTSAFQVCLIASLFSLQSISFSWSQPSPSLSDHTLGRPFRMCLPIA